MIATLTGAPTRGGISEFLVRTAEEEAAAKGAVLLDDQMSGWEWRLDLDRLNISNADDCALGQLDEEGYVAGRKALGLTESGAREHGFTAGTRTSYEKLTEAWRAEVEARRYG